MTAGQNAGQLRRANPSGMYVAIAAVVAGALAIGLLATLASRPSAVTPGTAPAPVPAPDIQFRLEEHGQAVPAAVPDPSVQYRFRLQERGQALPVNTEAWARAQMTAAAGSATAIPAPNSKFLLEEHGQAVSVNSEGTSATWPKGR